MNGGPKRRRAVNGPDPLPTARDSPHGSSGLPKCSATRRYCLLQAQVALRATWAIHDDAAAVEFNSLLTVENLLEILLGEHAGEVTGNDVQRVVVVLAVQLGVAAMHVIER